MKQTKRVALVYNDVDYLHRFKGGLLRSLVEAGYEVFAICPGGKSVDAIQRTGATFIDWPLSRSSFNPITELKSVIALWNIYRKIEPDLVHHFTLKPNLYGALVAWFAGISVILSSINGLGYVFIEKGLKAIFIRQSISMLYRIAFGMSKQVIFQNADDATLLVDRGIVSPEKTKITSGGAGIDTSYFDPHLPSESILKDLRISLDLRPQTKIVLTVSRMLVHKGISELVCCARELTKRRDVYFLLVGPTDPGNPASIDHNTLLEWEEQGWIRFLGERSDIRELMAISDIVALPSYREGFPRVLLEASAMGKPMVATDVPGCREIVEHGKNGLLVKDRDVDSLILAIEQLLDSPETMAQMGHLSRLKALNEYQESTVIDQTMFMYDELLSN